jgi:3-hydroxyisobutyrate dehydrogenase-like beta-hydroxyacid dehydrogenase
MAAFPTIRTVGIMSPGEMGHAIGRRLREHGLRVITCLQGRSARTAALAAAAGIDDTGDDATLVHESDVLLAVLVPAEALGLARRIALALRTTGATLLYVDCNAISPQTARQIEQVVTAAGARFADAGIIGGPPAPGRAGPRIYASGIHAAEFTQLREYGLDIRIIDGDAGQASGLKMCYAALTKGLTALATELLVAAELMGLSEPLRAELQSSQPDLLTWIERQAPGMPPKAYRWVGEMEEIAATFGALGLTPKLHQGAAELYRFVAQTPLGVETPEQRRRGQTLDDLIAVLAGELRTPVAGDSAASTGSRSG